MIPEVTSQHKNGFGTQIYRCFANLVDYVGQGMCSGPPKVMTEMIDAKIRVQHQKIVTRLWYFWAAQRFPQHCPECRLYSSPIE